MDAANTHRDLVEAAARAAGSQRELAMALGVTQQNVSYWKRSRVPFEYGAPMESITRGVVTRQALFPDDYRRLWPELAANDRGSNNPGAAA